MIHRKVFQRVFSIICAMCLVLSLLGNDFFATAAKVLASDESIEQQESSDDSGDTMSDLWEDISDAADDEASVTEDNPESNEAEAVQDQAALENDDLTGTEGVLTEGDEDAEADEEAESDTEELSEQTETEEVEVEETEVEETEAEAWNAEPITGSCTSDKVTVSVTAPEGSFPEGTVLNISSLSKSDLETRTDILNEAAGAAGFDISFIDSEGKRVQPGNGKTVDVSFFISEGTIGESEEIDKSSTLKVYHLSDGGDAELLKQERRTDTNSSASISVEADSFSAYVLAESYEKARVLRAPVLRSGTPQVVDVSITKLEIQNLSHQTVDRVFYSDTFYLAMSWDASSLGTNLHEGDYFDITLPENMMFPSSTTARDFDLLDENGNVIATAHVTPGAGDVGGNLRVTFTDVVEDQYDVKGTIYLAARFDREQITIGESNTFSITVNGEVQGSSHTSETGVVITGPKELENEYLAKWGQSVYNQPNLAEWWVRINHTKATLSNVIITDTLGSTGETYIADSFSLRLVEFDAYGNVVTSTIVDISDKLTISPDGSSFSLALGDINGEQYRLTYRTTYTPGTTLRNSLKLDSTEAEKTYSATHISAESGGSAGGSLASKIRIIKVDENDVSIVLANAVFRVTAPNGDTFTLTTGADGTVTSGSLTQGRYSVEEITPPDGYEIIPEESTFTMDVTSSGGAVRRVKNRPIATVDIPVSKIWSDSDNQDGIRPLSITVKLLADGAETGETIVLTEANNWQDSFTELRKTDPIDGHEISYSVEEEGGIPGYTSRRSGDAESGFIITNTHQPETIDISGSKTWDDNNNQDGVRPRTVTIRLLADGVEKDSATVSEADNWSWSFTNLPKYKNGGTEIKYSITEDAVNDYTPDYDGYNVTNTHTPGKTSFSVSKAWDDVNNQDGIRPGSVTVKLLADDVDTGKTVELNENNNWTASFTDLDEYQNGKKITYKVEEVKVTGYTTTIAGGAEIGYTITNKHDPEVIDISGSKTWDDNNNQDGVRPQTITIRLLADGNEINSATAGADNNWSWRFTNLPKYKDGGKEISYTITEDAVSGYTPDYNGFDVTNKHTPGKTSVSVTKVWDDYNNREGSRPGSVTIRLLADDKDTGKSLVLNAGNSWTGTFTDLDEYKDGEKIVYTVSEDSVSGYTTSIKGDATAGFTVTNTKIATPPTPETPTPSDPGTPSSPEPNTPAPPNTPEVLGARATTLGGARSPQTGDIRNIGLYLSIMLASGGALILLLAKMKRKREEN